VRTDLSESTGDIVVIQDLEYDPEDCISMFDLIAVRRVADVVFGSRFHGRLHRSLYFHHYLGNRLISLLFNALYNQMLIEACYKIMTREVKESLRLTKSLCRSHAHESGGSTSRPSDNYGRIYSEGKKIDWRDGFKALWYLVKYRLAP
jgi:hypothetical protein